MGRKDNKSEKKKNGQSRPLSSIRKLLDGLCDSQGCYCEGVDSHKWKNKIEALRMLSGGYR